MMKNVRFFLLDLSSKIFVRRLSLISISLKGYLFSKMQEPEFPS